MHINHNNGQHGKKKIPKDTLKSWQLPIVVLLDLTPSQHEGNHSWYWKSIELTRASEVMGDRGESTTNLAKVA